MVSQGQGAGGHRGRGSSQRSRPLGCVSCVQNVAAMQAKWVRLCSPCRASAGPANCMLISDETGLLYTTLPRAAAQEARGLAPEFVRHIEQAQTHKGSAEHGHRWKNKRAMGKPLVISIATTGHGRGRCSRLWGVAPDYDGARARSYLYCLSQVSERSCKSYSHSSGLAVEEGWRGDAQTQCARRGCLGYIVLVGVWSRTLRGP